VPLALVEHVHMPLDLLDDAAAALEAGIALEPALHRKALELVEVILARQPRSIRGTRARARSLAAAGRADEAVAGFRALADLDRRSLPDALEGLDSVLRDAPRHAEARLRRAEVLVEMGRAKEAVEALDALLGDVAGGDAMELRALSMLASAREALQDFDGAREALRLAGRRHPAEPAIPVRLRANRAARLACEIGRHRAAREEGKPGDADLDLAEALLESGDAAAAPTAAGPEPGDGPALSRWRTLRGRAFLRLGAPGDAVEELEKAVDVPGTAEGRTPAARDALFYCGVAQLRMGETLKAIRRLEQAAHADPGHRRVREVLDRVYSEERGRLERPTALTEDLETLQGNAGA
jgi:tetratricopeptide (TPR) repeat protein